MTPGQRAWSERMSEQWSARVAQLRDDPSPCASIRASAIESIVGDLERRLAIRVDRAAAAVAELERRLAAIAPYRDPGSGVMFNDTPLLEPARHRLRCELAFLRGDPPPAALEQPATAPIAAQIFAPPDEPLPFASGPQLDMFSLVPELYS